jgi:hypothetical protein
MPMPGVSRRRWLGVRPFAAGLLIADAGLVMLWLEGALEASAVLGGHVGCVMLLFGILFPLQRTGRGELVAAAGFALLVGPIAGPGLFVIESGSSLAFRGKGATSGELPRPQTLADRVVAQIEQGRRHPGAAAVAMPFARIFRDGALVEQQTAIAAISRAYDARMLPALNLALASEVPAIRVQAAAVYAKLRGTFGASAKSLLERDWDEADPRELSRMATEARRVADSGFVDAERARELRTLATRLCSTDLRAGLAPAVGRAYARTTKAGSRPRRLWRHACGGIA